MNNQIETILDFTIDNFNIFQTNLMFDLGSKTLFIDKVIQQEKGNILTTYIKSTILLNEMPVFTYNITRNEVLTLTKEIKLLRVIFLVKSERGKMTEKLKQQYNVKDCSYDPTIYELTVKDFSIFMGG